MVNIQLGLRLEPKLLYSPDNFVVHEGIRTPFDEIISECSQPRFSSFYVQGTSRTGKTHLSIALVDALTRRGLFPRILEGPDFGEWLGVRGEEGPTQPEDIYIIDDAQQYLGRILPGQSGPFVDFVEQARRMQAAIVFFSSAAVTDLPGDDHLKSRLRAAFHFHLSPPPDEDMVSILHRMAQQRGLRLSDHKARFILRRTGRDIAAVEAYLERVQHLTRTIGAAVKLPLLTDALETAGK